MKSILSKYLRVLPAILVFILTFHYSFAASLELQKIGALDLGGKSYPEWWYTGSNPVFSGVAEPGAPVNIKIGESVYNATPDSSGAWTYASVLENGDHNVAISQGESNITFVLHLGQTVPSNTTSSGSTPATSVPETGFNQYVALSFGVGIIMLSTYLYFSSDSKGKRVFESRMLKED